MNKLTPSIGFFCFYFISSAIADESQSISTAKEQVLGLLDMIEDRNKLINEKMFGTTSEEDNKPKLTEKTTKAQQTAPVAQINPSINAFINGVRDPFAITQEIALLSQENQTSQSAYANHDFKSSGLAFTLPKLTMKGVVFKKQNPIALLEIGGNNVYMVRVGDEISFNPAMPKQVIKVKKISRLNVIVEVGTLGDLIVVR